MAATDDAFRRLLGRFVDVYADHLFNEHWGEQARANHRNAFEVTMLFQGLDTATARAAWAGLIDFVAAHPEAYRIEDPLTVAAFPARAMWDEGPFCGRILPP